jgi:hypothetical protein
VCFGIWLEGNSGDNGVEAWNYVQQSASAGCLARRQQWQSLVAGGTNLAASSGT